MPNIICMWNIFEDFQVHIIKKYQLLSNAKYYSYLKQPISNKVHKDWDKIKLAKI